MSRKSLDPRRLTLLLAAGAALLFATTLPGRTASADQSETRFPELPVSNDQTEMS